MYRTIQLSTCVSVQGELVETHADGQVLIRAGAREYLGRPILRPSALIAEIATRLDFAARPG